MTFKIVLYVGNMMNAFESSSSQNNVFITGMSGRFPNCDNVSDYFEGLLRQKDFIGETPKEWLKMRSDLPLRLGRLNERKKFDAGFFGLHHGQAEAADPACRILLEVTTEAIIDAGLNPTDLAGTKTGVFVAGNMQETEHFWYYKNAESPNFSVAGCSRSTLAQRLSYHLRLEGPSVEIDVACSGTGYAVEQAFKAIMSGRCDNALVGGVTLNLSCDVLRMVARFGTLDMTGNNCVLSKEANGYIRSEAIVVILLQKLRNSKRIYSQIVHAKTNCDGFKEKGITHSSEHSQIELLRNAYKEAQINPLDITYLEAHSTGTKVGDEYEMKAISTTFSDDETSPILIGSVKSNIGHTESVSALCSLVKVVLGMENETIPPTIIRSEVRKDVPDLCNGKILVLTKNLSLLSDQYAAINNSGFGGTNAHVILKSYNWKSGDCTLENQIVCVSARTEDSVQRMLNSISHSKNQSYYGLLRNIFRYNIDGFCYRGFAVISKDNIFTSHKKCNESKFSLCLIDGNDSTGTVGRNLSEITVFGDTIKRIGAEYQLMSGTISQLEKKVFLSVAAQIALVETFKLLEIPVGCVSTTPTGVIADAYAKKKLTLTECLSAVCSLSKFLENFPSTHSVITKELLRFDHLSTLFADWRKTRNFWTNMITTDTRVSPGVFLRAPSATYKILDVQSFLSTLGLLYETGFNPKIDKLYPIKFPVKAPSISPLITWYHQDDWHVIPSTSRNVLGGKSFGIGTVDEEENFKYLLNHDCYYNQSLLPTSAYIYFVWKTYAEINKSLVSNSSISLADVRLHQATDISEASSMNLDVQILKISKRFEVSCLDKLLVSGSIQEKSDKPLKTTDQVSTIDNPLFMSSIYKYLGLHGYKYKNEFCGIEKVNSKVTHAMVKWSENWITFLDHIFTLKYLRECSDGLRRLTYIDRINIDPSILPKSSNLVRNYLECNLIQSSQVEVRGLVHAPIVKNVNEEKPILETYRFVPYFGSLSFDDSIYAIVKIIMDNNRSLCVKILELDASGLSIQISSLLDEHLVPNKIVSTDIKPDTNLVITVFNRVQIVDLLEKMQEEAFLLVRGYPNSPLFDLENAVVVSAYNTGEDTIYLLRKIDRCLLPELIFLKHDWSWLVKLQSSLRDGRDVLLVVENNTTSGILGFMSAIRREYQYPAVSCAFLQDNGSNFATEIDLFRNQLKKRLAVNVLKNGQWGSYVYFPLRPNWNRTCGRINGVVKIADLSSFCWIEAPPIPKELSIAKVHYVGLGYYDVLHSTGKLRHRSKSDEVKLGSEFSGTDQRGKKIMGIVKEAALSNMAPIDPFLNWKVPSHWSLEDSATVPFSYCAVLYTLMIVAKLKMNQTVLIHTGAEDLRQSAINVATAYNCKIFTTIQSLEEKKFFRSLCSNFPENCIGHCQDSQFQEFIMRETHGRGVDVILDTSASSTSLRCLAPGGVFLKVGAIENQMLDLKCIANGRTYHGVRLDKIFGSNTRVKKSLQDLLHRGIQAGHVKPIPKLVLDQNGVGDALNRMISDNQISKAVIKVEEFDLCPNPRFYCHPNKSYVLVGGLGGFGLELTDWLIGRGAKKVVLVSRRSTLTDYQSFKLKVWKECGVDVIVSQKNLLTLEGCTDLIDQIGSIDAVFNLAAVVSDALFENQTTEKFRTVLKPKTQITESLDVVTRRCCPDLRYFVVFSSISSGKGNIGQTNYCMANSVIERICEIRKEEGYPAVAIQLGAIADVGMLRNDTSKNIGVTTKQSVHTYLEQLDTLLTQDEAIVASSVWTKKTKTDSLPLSLAAEVAKVIGINLQHVSYNTSLSQLGMDSIIMVNVKQILEDKYSIFMPIRDLRQITLSQLEEKGNDREILY